MRILLAEDQPRLGALVKRSLMEDGYTVDLSASGIEAEDLFDINEYDLIILDIMLPGKNGLAVCKAIRTTGSTVPIIMLTALDGTADRVNGLDNGADDYLVKPFSMDELSARIRALLRRGAAAKPSIIMVRELQLDPAMKRIEYRGKEVPLTAKEYALLSYFMYHPGEMLSKNTLLEHVWDMNYDGISNIVETYIRYVRAKLRVAGVDDELITTVRNLGYRLES